MNGNTMIQSLKSGMVAEPLTIHVEQAILLTDHVIVATGIASMLVSSASSIRFTHVLSETNGHWQLASVHLTPLQGTKPMVAFKRYRESMKF